MVSVATRLSQYAMIREGVYRSTRRGECEIDVDRERVQQRSDGDGQAEPEGESDCTPHRASCLFSLPMAEGRR
jgi:hypothetical protein